MRLLFVIAALLFLPTPSHAQCFPITPSGKDYFNRHLTPAERCAARAEAKRRSCPDATVHEATPGAINRELAQQLLPHVRGHLAAEARTCQESSAAPKKRSRVAKQKQRPKALAIPLPRSRPQEAMKIVPVAPPEIAVLPQLVAEPTPDPTPKRRCGFMRWLFWGCA